MESLPTDPLRTPAGERLSGWLHAVNGGDYETIRRFMEEALTPGALAERSAASRATSRLRLHLNTRGLAPRRILPDGPDALEAFLRAELSEEWWRIRVEVERRPPHRIRRLTLHHATEPEDLRERKPLTDRQAAARIEAYVDRLARADVFSGAVLFARGAEPLFVRAWGYADRDRIIPNRIDTRFNLGSVNKMVTAVAIAQLVEAGRLSFSDTVGKILPGYPNRAVAEGVTVHHLLTHTGGLGTYFNPRFQAADKRRFRAVDDYDPLYIGDAPDFAPGARFSYSNAGFMVLGKVVEAVTGEDYFEYVRRRIYRPAGMERTDSYDMDADVPDLAIGYTRTGDDGAWHPGARRSNRPLSYVKGSPAGGGFSTVEDLLRFSVALRDGTLLSAESVRLLQAPHVATDFDPSVQHGYGTFLETVNGRRIAYHTGVFPGVNSHLDMVPETGHTLVVLANDDPPSATRIARRVRDWITRAMSSDSPQRHKGHKGDRSG